VPEQDGIESRERIMNWKTIWAVVAGVLFIIVVTTLVDIVLHAIRVFPPMNQPINDALALLATSYRIVIGVGGAWLTARLAPDKPLGHALLLGYVGTFLGLVGVVATWNLGLGPRWYPMALAVLAIPQCWAGGKLFEMRAGRR
jgi:RsiW-degrading membrane proteinase PrsW (M82 family)